MVTASVCQLFEAVMNVLSGAVCFADDCDGEAKGESQLLVRANGQYQGRPVIDPKPYQDFLHPWKKQCF